MLKFLNTDEQVARYFKDYYGVMLLQFPLMVINSSLGMFIRGEGNPKYFMQVNIVNVVLNIMLDYMFVCLLDLGVIGAAVSSLIAGVVTLLLIIHFFVKKSSVYSFRKFRFSKGVLKDTLFNGGSEFIGEMSMSISMFAYNYVILQNIGVDGVTAFAIVGYICYIFNVVLIGFGQGASPLISFSYGAKEYLLARNLRKINVLT